MYQDNINTKVYAMLPNQLTDFVHNTAKVGDIATAYDPTTKRNYIYFCTEKNIGKNIKPFWMVVDEKRMLKNMFDNMILEEKVDFLIDKYIETNK